ncbi:MAG: S-layer homology domain-containing protein [Candidatus Metalachnospira sp.]|nr:S-layer homology domain-containing protein [Candidatus Metalachnospira sp.]
MKKFIALAVTAVMTIGSVITVNAATFSDINDVPWEGAKEYIYSVSDLGLMVGDADSSGHKVFRANDRITYCEAMQLAYSILKNAGAGENYADTVSKWKSVMQAAYIPEWAYTCVSYGLENGILSENDVTIFMKGEGASRDATRENVSVIFGKAIEHLSAVKLSAVLTFNDKDKIAATSVPYIEMLSRLGIIVGDDGGNFNPRNYINRAEMAVMTSKTYYKAKELKEAEDAKKTEVQTFSGTVILTDDGNTSKTIDVSANEIGAVSTFTINSSTTVINSENVAGTYSDISIGDIITVSSMNGAVVSVVVDVDNDAVSVEEKSKPLSGYMNHINDSSIIFEIEDDKQELHKYEYQFDNDVVFTLNGEYVGYNDIKNKFASSDIFVTVELNDDKLVTKIDAKVVNIKGTLKIAETSKIVVAVDDATRMSLAVGKGIVCSFNGENVSYIQMKKLVSEEKNVMLVEAQMDETGYTVIKMTVVSSKDNEGTVTSFSGSGITFVNSVGIEYTYKVEPAAVGYIDGESITSLANVRNAALTDGATIKVTFSSRGYVNRIYVTTEKN